MSTQTTHDNLVSTSSRWSKLKQAFKKDKRQHSPNDDITNGTENNKQFVSTPQTPQKSKPFQTNTNNNYSSSYPISTPQLYNDRVMSNGNGNTAYSVNDLSEMIGIPSSLENICINNMAHSPYSNRILMNDISCSAFSNSSTNESSLSTSPYNSTLNQIPLSNTLLLNNISTNLHQQQQQISSSIDDDELSNHFITNQFHHQPQFHREIDSGHSSNSNNSAHSPTSNSENEAVTSPRGTPESKNKVKRLIKLLTPRRLKNSKSKNSEGFPLKNTTNDQRNAIVKNHHFEQEQNDPSLLPVAYKRKIFEEKTNIQHNSFNPHPTSPTGNKRNSLSFPKLNFHSTNHHDGEEINLRAPLSHRQTIWERTPTTPNQDALNRVASEKIVSKALQQFQKEFKDEEVGNTLKQRKSLSSAGFLKEKSVVSRFSNLWKKEQKQVPNKTTEENVNSLNDLPVTTVVEQTVLSPTHTVSPPLVEVATTTSTTNDDGKFHVRRRSSTSALIQTSFGIAGTVCEYLEVDKENQLAIKLSSSPGTSTADSILSRDDNIIGSIHERQESGNVSNGNSLLQSLPKLNLPTTLLVEDHLDGSSCNTHSDLSGRDEDLCEETNSCHKSNSVEELKEYEDVNPLSSMDLYTTVDESTSPQTITGQEKVKPRFLFSYVVDIIKDTSLTDQLCADKLDTFLKEYLEFCSTADDSEYSNFDSNEVRKLRDKEKPKSSLLHQCAKYNRALAICTLVTEYRCTVEAKDELESTPLHWACSHRSIDSIMILCNLGAKINIRDKYGKAPIHVLLTKACQDDMSNDIITCKKCFEGAKIMCGMFDGDYNFKTTEGSTVLHIACEMGAMNVVQYLVGESSDLNTTNSNSSFSQSNNKVLLNAKDKLGKTPIMRAAAKGHVDIVEYIVNNSKPNVVFGPMSRDEKKQNILHQAAVTGNDQLINRIAYLNPQICELMMTEQDANGDSPLHCACLRGNVKTVNLLLTLLKSGVVNVQNEKGDTPLHVACRFKDKKVAEKICRYLYQNGANPDIKNLKEETPRQLASDTDMRVGFEKKKK
ncbi:hypothetical protein ABK040_006045 [Willaertia magna]